MTKDNKYGLFAISTIVLFIITILIIVILDPQMSIAQTPNNIEIETVCNDTTKLELGVIHYPKFDMNLLCDTSEEVPDMVVSVITWNRGIVVVNEKDS